MKYYECSNCSRRFDFPKEIVTTYEDFVGVSHIFPTRTPMFENVCPFCDSDEIYRVEENDG